MINHCTDQHKRDLIGKYLKDKEASVEAEADEANSDRFHCTPLFILSRGSFLTFHDSDFQIVQTILHDCPLQHTSSAKGLLKGYIYR